MKTKLSMLLVILSVGASWGLNGCKDISCDTGLTRKDPATGKEAHLVEGSDGLCHWPWYDEENWGTTCGSNEDCGGNLLCLAPDLPICTRIDCSLKDDDVCGPGFLCIATGEGKPNVCIPGAAPGTGGASGSGGSASMGGGGMGGVVGTGGMTEVMPNVGTACSMTGDSVCVGGTFCEASMLNYCTVAGCIDPGAAKDACDAVSAQGYTCFTGNPMAPTGVCVKF